MNNEEQVELSFVRMWDFSLEGKYVPLNIDKRFIVLRGSSGFYSYAIYEHLPEWPPFEIGETRITFKLRKDKYSIYALCCYINSTKYFIPFQASKSRGEKSTVLLLHMMLDALN
ncbi:hypothetical protein SAY86_020947 [Trapa natans]|uniref:Uncharacterized protein n=1 Tax=Trapa natans TaxID=22666 RepID=A0AAN7M741_TRANT|nr:hypothetical protein SAY86_020947 [Trapa natans]